MKIENPAALRFIITDDLYLLPGDKIAPQTQVIQRPPQPAVIEPSQQTPVVDFKYKGGNKKQFLILVNYPSVDFIDDGHLAALENILKRKDLGLDDVAIVNLAKYADLPTKELLGFFKPQRLLLMGKEAVPESFVVPAFNQSMQVDDIKTLFSYSFAEMMDSNDNKKTFWEQMKTL